MEAELNLLKKEIEDYTYRCTTEAKKMKEEVQSETHNLDVVEREAAEVLKVLYIFLPSQKASYYITEHELKKS